MSTQFTLSSVSLDGLRRMVGVYYDTGHNKFTTSGAHDVITITLPQKNDLCTDELEHVIK